MRKRIAAGERLDDGLVEAFALAREAARRCLGERPVAEQLMAGLALHQGRVAELATGEGKTLAATAPVFLAALSGQGVHVLTFNDYLARRDATWMGPVYRMLGVSVGVIQENQTAAERRRAYAQDVTYATAKQVGFDLLRDGRCRTSAERVQRAFHFAVVDEADSILVDEARIPLVLAGATDDQVQGVRLASGVADGLETNRDFTFDPYAESVSLTDAGIDQIEGQLDRGDLHDPLNRDWLTLINQAIYVRVMLRRGITYIVRDGRAELIDEFTGRVVDDRRWPHGLQAALHAKEGLQVEPEGEVLGTITLQHLLGLYPKLSGMTATAWAARDELHDFYGLGVVQVPPHRPSQRQDLPDLIYSHREEKERAVADEVARLHATGRPLLIGTLSVAESEQLAAVLEQRGISCRVLNACNDAQEASVIAEAGRLGAVTVSTNMAGRGVDIKLGGTDEAEREQVLALGGLFVIGTNRHDSRRIDDQLRGRSARQGEPGGSRFFASFEDELMVRYGLAEILASGKRPPKTQGPLQDPVLASEIERAQQIIEAEHLKLRRLLYRYAQLGEVQRQAMARRRAELQADDFDPRLETLSPTRYGALLPQVGRETLVRVERELTLHHLDRTWRDHLAVVADIYEALPVSGMGGRGILVGLRGPMDDFNHQVDQAFTRMLTQVDKAVTASFERAAITKDGIDLHAEGLLSPSSTWTYLTEESPLGDGMLRIMRGIKKAISRRRSSA